MDVTSKSVVGCETAPDVVRRWSGLIGGLLRLEVEEVMRPSDERRRTDLEEIITGLFKIKHASKHLLKPANAAPFSTRSFLLEMVPNEIIVFYVRFHSD